MSRRQRGLSPTLFPFLAVLVCTLGTLILLLALVAQNATAKATIKEQQSDPERNRNVITSQQIKQLRREEAFRLDAIIAFRDAQTQDLEEQRELQTHLEDHIDRIKKKLQALQDEITYATERAASDSVTQDDLKKLTSRRDAMQSLVDDLIEESQESGQKVVIVPHQGPNGTDRRAVYLECGSTGITVWPEGSRITTDQLERSNDSANPLDAALRTIRLHALKHYGDTDAPYPLLIVRPDGIESYGAARRSMKTWDDQFGYELIDSETELTFPEKDLNLREKVDRAIAEAIQGQRRQSPSGIARVRDDGTRPNLRAQSTRLPTLSAAAMERSSRASGFRSLRDQYQPAHNFTPNPQGISPGIQGKSAWNQIQESTATSDRIRSTTDFTPTNKNRSSAIINQVPNRPSYTAPRQSDLTRTTSGSTKNRLDLADNHRLHTSSADGSANSERPLAGSQGQPIQGNRVASPEHQSNGNNPTSSGELQTRLEGGMESPNTGSNETETTGTTEAAHSAENASGSSPAMNHMSKSKPGGVSSSIGSAFETMEEPEDHRIKSPPTQIPSTPVKAPKTKPLLQKLGNHWAIPESIAQMRGNEIIRTLRVEIHDDRLVLLPSRDAASIEIFSFFDGNFERAALQLATAIHNRINQWGPALPGGKWQPRLEIVTKSRSPETFDLLKNYFHRSGLDIVRKEKE